MKNRKFVLLIPTLLICSIILFNNCATTGPAYNYNIRVVASVPTPFEPEPLLDRAVRVLSDNFPNMSLEYQNTNLFHIEEISQAAWDGLYNDYFNIYTGIP